MAKTWTPGKKISSPVDQMVDLDVSKLSMADIYKLMIGSVVPRPIAFVSTVNPHGVGNLAPFSYFNAVSSDPACLSISITRKENGYKKDTLRNIEDTGQLVINTVSEWMAEPMNYCSGEFPYGVSEMELVGLTPLPSVKVKPPRVKEAPVQFECEVYKLIDIGQPKLGGSTLVIARIVHVHVFDKAYLGGGKISIDALKPLSRLGGLSYGKTSDIFDLDRPVLEKSKAEDKPKEAAPKEKSKETAIGMAMGAPRAEAAKKS